MTNLARLSKQDMLKSIFWITVADAVILEPYSEISYKEKDYSAKDLKNFINMINEE